MYTFIPSINVLSDSIPLPPFEHYFADPEQYYINSTDCGPQTPMQITPQFSFQIPCNITAAVCDSVKLGVCIPCNMTAAVCDSVKLDVSYFCINCIPTTIFRSFVISMVMWYFDEGCVVL